MQFSKIISLIMNLFVIAGTILVLLHTTNFSIGLFILSCIYVLIILIRDFIWKVDLQQKLGLLFFIIQLILALIICVWSESFFGQIFLLVLIGEISFHRSMAHSLIFTIITYISILIGVLIYRNFLSLANEIYLLFPRVIDYFAIFGMSHLARITLMQKNKLARDYEQLSKASIELETKAQLQERARISREIHDSVGLTLTSALTGLQTAKHAIEKEHYPIAKEMIDRTKDYIKRGLDDVRNSIHLLRENDQSQQFIPDLIKLIEETRKQTYVEIEYEIDSTFPIIPPMMEVTIYRALQEGMSNGLRHGSSTSFHFSLTYNDQQIRFVLTDNGQSTATIIPGFGLTAMNERVKEIHGKLSISTTSFASGTTLEITIPFKSNTFDGSM